MGDARGDTGAAADLRHALDSIVIDSLHEGVVVMDAAGRVAAHNAHGLTMLGLGVDAEGAVLKPAGWQALHEDGRPMRREEYPFVRVLASGRPMVGAVVGIRLPDGRELWTRVNATPIALPGGPGVVSSSVDITERYAARKAIRDSEERLRATLDGLAEGVIFYDEAGAIAAVNHTARTLLQLGDGLPRSLDELLGQRRPVDAAGQPVGLRPLLGAARRDGAPVDRLRCGLRGDDGDEQWVEISVRPITGGRAPYPVVASFSDVTAEIVQQRALADSQSRFATTFATAAIGMAIVGLDGRFLRVNDALASLVGYPVAQLQALAFADITHPDDVEADLASVQALIAGASSSYRMDKRYLHADGHVVWVQLDAAIVRDADGRPQYFISQIQDITERRRQEEQLRHLADHDALTGLLNRRGFETELEQHVARVARDGAHGAVLMLDLDHFKYVNDTLGHKAGDEIIVKAADLLSRRLRATDVVARLGGDEFAVLLPQGGAEEARRVAVSLMEGFRRSGATGLTASVGIATCTADVGAEELLVNADLAMYDAKETGRGRWAVYSADGDVQPRMAVRLSWLERVKRAIDEDGFELHAQPIVGLRDARVRAPMFELLLRMRSDGGELIPPAAFLSIAERVDLIQSIDRMVVLRAIEVLAAAPADVVLTVNVSGKTFGDPELLFEIEQALGRTGVDGARLVFEITETAAVAQIARARGFAEGLHLLGARLAIDDFGAGFGSFTYLKHLPFDFLKIDGEFVSAALRSRADALIVSAVRHMAHGMGREVIAEHCTDESVLDFLRAEGVDYAQGFHLGRPAPLADVLGALSPS